MEIYNAYIKEIRPIEDLNYIDYIHLLELNIEFAKRHQIKPRLPETYGNIVKEGRYGGYILYGDLNEYRDYFGNYDKLPYKIKRSDLLRISNCHINEKGMITKNRWGDQEYGDYIYE